MLAELKKFALKGNVLDLAVGVIIGGAFGKIVTGLVDDVIMPVVSLAMPEGDWREAGFTLAEQGAAGPEGDVILKWGHLLSVTIDFVIVAFVLFLVVRAANRLLAAAAEPAPAPAALVTRECPACLESVPKKATRCKFCTSELHPT